jgi:hypothetical protein
VFGVLSIRAISFMSPVIRTIWVRLLAGVSLGAIIFSIAFVGGKEWWNTVAAPHSLSCQVYSADWDWGQHFRLLDLNIESQEPREPVFDGSYVVNLGEDFGKTFVLKLTKASQSTHSYGDNTYRPTLYWDEGYKILWSAPPAKMTFVSKATSHYMFPFDSAEFDEKIVFDPPIDHMGLHLTNRVSGFYLPVSTCKFQIENGIASLFFELRRNSIIKYIAILLFVIAALFAILITIFMDNGPLPHALSSYFFAVWSIRGVFGLTVEGFPTAFDLGIIGLVLLAVFLLILRGLGIRQALVPVGRCGRNWVRKLEGRELLPAPEHGHA